MMVIRDITHIRITSTDDYLAEVFHVSGSALLSILFSITKAEEFTPGVDRRYRPVIVAVIW